MRKSLHLFLTLSLFVSFVGISMAQNPATYLKHKYTFKEDASDAIGGAGGTLMGGAYVLEGSLVCTAAGDALELPAPTMALNTYSEVTMEIWFTSVAGGNTGYTMLCYFGGSEATFGSNGMFMTAARGDNKSRAAISCLNTASPWGTESGVDGPEQDDGVKHQYICTINGTQIAFYIDGVQQGTAVDLSADNKIANIKTDFGWLAKGGYTGDPTWLGSIDEFAIYNKALSQDEVTYLFNRTSAQDLASNSFKPAVSTRNGVVMVSLKGTGSKSASLEVYNLAGSKVQSVANFTNETNVSLSRGIFLVKVKDSNKTYIQKVAVR